MFAFIIETAARSTGLGVIVWLSLRLLGIRNPQSQSLAWSAVLFGATAMPLLSLVMVALVANVPDAARWIPATSPVILRPIGTTFSAGPGASINWLRVVSGVYVLIGGALLLRLVTGLFRSGRLWKASVPLKELSALGSDIRVSTQLAIPVTFGSTILLPSDWSNWSAFKRDAVLAHEQSHVRRGDFYVHLLAGFHRAVYWFNPMAWWLQRHLLELAEATCDDDALRQVDDRISYAEILVDLAKRNSQSGFVGLAMARGKTVERRVERLLREMRISPTPTLFRRVLIAGAIATLTALVAGSWIVQAETVPGAFPLPVISLSGSQPPPQQLPSPVQQEPGKGLAGWMESEVPDIATEDEIAAFHALQTDEEPKQFIEAFWLRRDPTPGTLDNEFRDEYYRRIQVANQKFESGPVQPGWRTDRGRILTRFGEPDQVETHSLGGPGTTPPSETWRYRFIEGLGRNVIFEFVDAGRNGNYQLSTNNTDSRDNKVLKSIKP